MDAATNIDVVSHTQGTSTGFETNSSAGISFFKVDDAPLGRTFQNNAANDAKDHHPVTHDTANRRDLSQVAIAFIYDSAIDAALTSAFKEIDSKLQAMQALENQANNPGADLSQYQSELKKCLVDIFGIKAKSQFNGVDVFADGVSVTRPAGAQAAKTFTLEKINLARLCAMACDIVGSLKKTPLHTAIANFEIAGKRYRNPFGIQEIKVDGEEVIGASTTGFPTAKVARSEQGNLYLVFSSTTSFNTTGRPLVHPLKDEYLVYEDVGGGDYAHEPWLDLRSESLIPVPSNLFDAIFAVQAQVAHLQQGLSTLRG